MNFFLYIIIATSFVFCSTYDDAKIHFDNKDYDKALVILQTEIDAKSANAKTFALVSEVAATLDDLENANAYILKAIENSDNDKYREYQKKLDLLLNGIKNAKKTFDSGYYEEALSDYNKLAETFSDNAMIEYNKGLVLKKMGNLDAAVQHYKKAISLNPFEEKYNKAIKAVAQTLAKNGDEEFRRKEYDTALTYYNQAVKYLPNYENGLSKLAKVNYLLKNYDVSKKWCNETLIINSENSNAIYILGKIYQKSDKLELAISTFEKLTVVNPQNSKGFYELGNTYKSFNNSEDAIISLNKAILIKSDYSDAYELLGLIYQEQDSLEKALFNFEKAIESNSKAYVAYNRLASVYNMQEKYEDARTSAKECLLIKRNYAAAMYELGIAELNLCNKVAAEDAFTKAKKDRRFRNESKVYLKILKSKDCN